MFLMYVDESGDSGLVDSPVRYYVLSGLVVHELKWRDVLEQILAFRKRVRDQHGLKLREELHASHLINKPGPLVRIRRHDRLTIIREFADALASIADANLIHIVVDKLGKPRDYDVFGNAWTALIQRLEDAISHQCFRGPRSSGDRAMILPDDTDQKRLRELVRRLRVHNPRRDEADGGWRNAPVTRVIEDPAFRDSAHSYLIQAADLSAFLLYQQLSPNAYMRKKSAHNYFGRLAPVLCAGSVDDPQGIVWL